MREPWSDIERKWCCERVSSSFIEGWVWLKEIVLVCTVFGYIRDMYIYIYQFKWRGYRFCRSLFNITWLKDIQIHWTCSLKTSGSQTSEARGALISVISSTLAHQLVLLGGMELVGDGNLVSVPVFFCCPQKTPFQHGVLVLIGL